MLVKSIFLSGYSTSCDGQHMTNPQTTTQRKVMIASLKDAQLKAKDIGYLNAHGASTQVGDPTQAASIQEVFANNTVLVNSTKSLHGHLLGAGGAIELLACISDIENHRLPTNSSHAEKDEDIQLTLVSKENQYVTNLNHVMSNPFAFGETNACLIISR